MQPTATYETISDQMDRINAELQELSLSDQQVRERHRRLQELAAELEKLST